MPARNIHCRCGAVQLEVRGRPIIVSECLCSSCREAGERFRALGMPSVMTSYGATPFGAFRKDRVSISAGADRLKYLLLSPDGQTRRFVATCCGTPMFMEGKGAHWLSFYIILWPEADRPQPKVRIMAADLADRSGLPEDIPNLATHSVGLYARLLLAWAAMGFRNPKIVTAGALND